MGGVYIFIISSHTTGADPGFLLGGGAPLRNDVTDRRGKQILKANMKASSQGGGGAHPLHPPPRSALTPFFGLQSDCCPADFKLSYRLPSNSLFTARRSRALFITS